MACIDCPICDLSMDFANWDDEPDKNSMGPVERKIFEGSPVSDTVSPVLEREDSLVEFRLVDCSDDDSQNNDGSVYDVGHSGHTCRAGKDRNVDTSVNSSVHSEESGFCSENTLNLQCCESSLWWTGETIVNPSEIGASVPVSPESPDSPDSPTDRRLDYTGFSDINSEVYNHRKDVENKTHFTNCLEIQREITPGIRGVLVSWLSKVHKEFQLSLDTLFLTVNIVDRLLKVKPVSRECFQLVGATAMLIAGKQEEVTPPEIQDLLWMCGDTYSREQMKELEKIILKAINFDLFVPTGSFFLEYFAFAEMSARQKDGDRLRNARRQAKYFLELSLQDYELCQYPPSMVALCAWKAAVRDCVSEYESYPPWEADFNSGSFEDCYSEFTTFMSRLTHSFPEANVLCEEYAYEDVDDSDSD